MENGQSWLAKRLAGSPLSIYLSLYSFWLSALIVLAWPEAN